MPEEGRAWPCAAVQCPQLTELHSAVALLWLSDRTVVRSVDCSVVSAVISVWFLEYPALPLLFSSLLYGSFNLDKTKQKVEKTTAHDGFCLLTTKPSLLS